MHIDEEAVSHIAGLARIALSETNAGDYVEDLEAILTMVDAMQALDTDNVTPLAHPLELTQRLRADEITETDQRERLLALAPATQDGFFLVPRVLE